MFLHGAPATELDVDTANMQELINKHARRLYIEHKGITYAGTIYEEKNKELPWTHFRYNTSSFACLCRHFLMRVRHSFRTSHLLEGAFDRFE